MHGFTLLFPGYIGMEGLSDRVSYMHGFTICIGMEGLGDRVFMYGWEL